ncbi:hypothetical protein [Chryseobacterium indologenes]|uniref:hypothetical protein n=1 Tax=Chryseobacterium indologenes TaxID=253 RepID=UPI0009A1BF65|nr:hypothetical protein [Chryseobacterium indologenes]
MKTYLLLLFLLGYVGMVFGQENFNVRYRIYDKLGDYTLKKNIKTSFESLSEEEKRKIKEKYKFGDKISVEDKVIIDGKEIKVIREITIDEKFFREYQVDEVVDANMGSMECGNVKVEKNKLLVNLLLKDGKSSPVYFYELQNRKSPVLYFTSMTLNALTIPIKYRFRGKNGLDEEFSTGINGNLFWGIYSYGGTTFFYKDEIETKENTWRITGGLLVGASSVKLNKSNTNLADRPITDDTEITKGLGSVALGITFMYNSINIGVFLGVDYAIGKDASMWNHNKKPWLGAGFGYKIF